MRFPSLRSPFTLLIVAGAALAAPAVDERFFVEKLYPVLEKAECRMCHNDNGVSSATRLQFPAPDAKTDAIQLFGLKLATLVNRRNVPQSLLLTKPSMRIPHTGGERIPKDSAEEETLKAWAAYLAALPESQLTASMKRLSSGAKKDSRPGVLRRLTHSQYNNTVRDLLGDYTRPADQFPPEDYLNGFTNQVEGQSVPPLLAEAYTVAAEKLAENSFRRGDTHNLLPCKPASTNDRSCRERFIRSFGLRAFRRPLTEQEVAAYSSLFAQASAERREFMAGARVVVEAMLQSPAFLFHLEDGPGGRSSQYGLASRLSYFLWDTMPDAELLRTAQRGGLATPAGVRRVAAAMLDHPQAKRALEVFLAQWMRFDRVVTAVRRGGSNSTFSRSLLPVMTEETRHLFNHLVWNDRNFMEMFSADYTFLSARLAQHYGIEAPTEEFGMVKYPPTHPRAGVLGHAGLLTLTASTTDTSPTARGLFVREHFLCQNVPPPPPGVDTNLPVVDPEKPVTNKERLQIHLTSPSCASCHNLIDPIGLGFEKFDNLGIYREKLALRIEGQRDAVTNKRVDPKLIELNLDTTAHIQGIPNSRFSSVKELGNILANDPTCQRCIVKQVFRYAAGRHENDSDQPYIDSLFELFQKSGFRFRDLVVGMVTSPPFLGNPLPPPVKASKIKPQGNSSLAI